MTDRRQTGEAGSPWTQFEIEAAVAAYAEMLDAERRGELYSKAEFNRRVDAMTHRGRGSIERKFQNISAVLRDEGWRWIDGYKPLSNVQYQLRATVFDVLGPSRRVSEALEAYADTAVPPPQPKPLSTDDVLVSPPGPGTGHHGRSIGIAGGSIDALHDLQRRRLGTSGEEWVIGLERERLRRAGRADLGDRLDWVARTKGDTAGFDIQSFWPDGRSRLIEVKTTNYGPRTPFYITRWEVQTSVENAASYSLYRVHGFARDPRLYVLDGNIKERATLEPGVFLGIPR